VLLIHRLAFISNRGNVPLETTFTGTRKLNAACNIFPNFFAKALESLHVTAVSIVTLNSASVAEFVTQP
jgi:hypothetical protein